MKQHFRSEILNWHFLLIILFQLLSTNTSAQHLDDYKWKKRIIVLVADTMESDALQRQLALLKGQKDEMTERDLIVLLADKNNVVEGNGNTIDITPMEVYEAAGLKSDFAGVLLFGKDGGRKLKKDFPVDPQELFELIDGMPMRRSEMKNK